MANLVHGAITGRGPVKKDGHVGTDVAFLKHPGEILPPDIVIPPGLPVLEILPLVGSVDMDTLHANWVSFDQKILGQNVFCELPRFTPDAEPPTGKKQYKVELTVTGTITEL